MDAPEFRVLRTEPHDRSGLERMVFQPIRDLTIFRSKLDLQGIGLRHGGIESALVWGMTTKGHKIPLAYFLPPSEVFEKARESVLMRLLAIQDAEMVLGGYDIENLPPIDDLVLRREDDSSVNVKVRPDIAVGWAGLHVAGQLVLDSNGILLVKAKKKDSSQRFLELLWT